MKNFIFIISLSFIIFSCKKEKNAPDKLPCPAISSCVQASIDSSMATSVGALWVEIKAYEYKGKYVYLYIAGCCDRFNDLRNENCQFMFSPSGGVAGCGDCRHPDFFNEAREICRVWKDPRI